MTLYQSSGILKYSHKTGYGYKLILEIDQEIVNYYRKLIPKWIKSSPQMYPAHVSIVRKEIPLNLNFWRKYDGKEIDFVYSNTIYFSENYVWLNVFSNKLEEIRLELGLPVSSPYTLPPEGFKKCFHTTIGNFKNEKMCQRNS